jgi:hypothetical protein
MNLINIDSEHLSYEEYEHGDPWRKRNTILVTMSKNKPLTPFDSSLRAMKK